MSGITIAGLRQPLLPRRLRLGFVGGGRGGLVGVWHAAGARLSNHWDIVAGALSSDPERARASAADWIIPPERSYADHARMARAEAARPDGIDAVVICTPNHTHFAIASAFLEAGIDVICDKPMTTTVADAEALVALAGEAGRLLLVSYPYGHHAMVRQARALIGQGAIGTIRQFHVEYLQEWATGPADPAVGGQVWRQDPALAGPSSALGDIGTHAYHLLAHVTGLDVTGLRADFHVCGAPKRLEDTAFVTLRLTGDIPGLMHVTQAAPGQHCGLRLRIWGDEGGLVWDQEHPEELRLSRLGEADRIIRRGQGGGMLPEAEWLCHLPRGHGEALTDAWANLYAEFGLAVAAHRTGRGLPPGLIAVPDGRDGLAGVRFTRACVESHRAGGVWIDMD